MNWTSFLIGVFVGTGLGGTIAIIVIAVLEMVTAEEGENL